MFKKDIIKLINLLTCDKYTLCTYKQSVEFDNKVNSLIKFIEKIRKQNGQND